jgi:hypothetical protein
MIEWTEISKGHQWLGNEQHSQRSLSLVTLKEKGQYHASINFGGFQHESLGNGFNRASVARAAVEGAYLFHELIKEREEAEREERAEAEASAAADKEEHDRAIAVLDSLRSVSDSDQ